MQLRNASFVPVARGLPPACRWIAATNGKSFYLHYHFGCIGETRIDGAFRVGGWGSRPAVTGRAASERQARHFVTRLIEVRGVPWKVRSSSNSTDKAALLAALINHCSSKET